MWRFLLLLSLFWMVPAVSGAVQTQSGLEISLKNDSERERATRAQLVRILEEYDVVGWMFTNRIIIEERTIPHSHPVLTLNTGHLGDDNHLLSTFIHEQLHWFLVDFGGGEMIAALRELYHEAPVGRANGGAKDTEISYLHLIVCMLEYEAMDRLIGADEAKALMLSMNHYQWIYQQVVENTESIQTILRDHNFILPPASGS